MAWVAGVLIALCWCAAWPAATRAAGPATTPAAGPAGRRGRVGDLARREQREAEEAARVAAAGPATAQQVEAAIQKAKDWLYSQQRDGNWQTDHKPYLEHGMYYHQNGGETALVTYALLAAGESSADPRIHKAVKYLLNCKTDDIYALGLRARSGCCCRNPTSRKSARPSMPTAPLCSMADILIWMPAAVLQGGLAKIAFGGFYSYSVKRPHAKHGSRIWNLSTSQYGVLGVWGCVQANFEVPINYWKAVDSDWRSIQQADGGWGYSRDKRHRPRDHGRGGRGHALHHPGIPPRQRRN